jgi:bifunctional non-homologous end joining protein LigD
VITIPAPMLAPERLFEPFTDDGWVYELKVDGYRTLAGVDGGSVRLLTKTGGDCTAAYPEVVRGLAGLQATPIVLDGEVTVINPEGLSDFNTFHAKRANRKRVPKNAPPVTFCVFDLLAMHGRKTTQLPYEARKRLLQELLATVTDPAVKFIGYVPADARVFHTIKNAGQRIEGFVAKRLGSAYLPGVRSDDWRKIKIPGWNEGRIWRS